MNNYSILFVSCDRYYLVNGFNTLIEFLIRATSSFLDKIYLSEQMLYLFSTKCGVLDNLLFNLRTKVIIFFLL
ncbi:hypothetical protein A1OE_925 [Candidatus Endolissoclinum faulkneri L2]|uniref:Uncharacterized protein n=1 Tax=Candidatus Endolissoclinum faulkneri L2 TaxID=1193729 RepID=K7Z4Y5_9PROT|nr:hypothetical protein A1OE_925 [Candidatus Endolissoclinum faulkneri L2]